MHALFRGISVVPVLTIDRERDAVPLARVLFEGGLPVIEITLRTPAAPAAIAASARELPHWLVPA
jgi:2-dehydro-3-deoxyphosphogluconate aldolase/(4S)-4-hydroxy-2-oxoglutarate aldolase